MFKAINPFLITQHPYPSEEQKKQLAQDTGLTILQGTFNSPRLSQRLIISPSRFS